MKAKISIVSKINLKKGHPIILDVSHSLDVKTSLRRKKTIGHSKIDHWDTARDLPLSIHPDYEYLYGKILEIRDKTKKHTFLKLTDIDAAVSVLIGPNITTYDVQEYAKKEIELLRSRGREGNADHVKSGMKAWAQYAPDLTFDKIDRELIAGFKRSYKGVVADTTVKAYIGVLRKIYNLALLDSDLKLQDNNAFKSCMSGLKIRMRRARNTYLNDKNIKKLIDRKVKGNFVISNSEHRALDLTLLQYYLGGANLKDICFLKRNQFYKKRVMMHRSKLGTDAEEFDLRVFKKAKIILEKYQGEDPVYWFPWRTDHKGYITFRDNHNRSLRSVQSKINLKLSPINDTMSSNVIRHTFATRAKFLGIDPDIIRELMGHERGDIDTVYKDVYPEKVRDKSHKKIILV